MFAFARCERTLRLTNCGKEAKFSCKEDNLIKHVYIPLNSHITLLVVLYALAFHVPSLSIQTAVIGLFPCFGKPSDFKEVKIVYGRLLLLVMDHIKNGWQYVKDGKASFVITFYLGLHPR